MRTAAGCLAALLAAAAALLFPGGGAAPGAEGGGGYRAGIDFARNGEYKVRAWQNGVDLGIGLYSAGSWRLLPEGRILVVIHNQESGGNWLYHRASNEVEEVDEGRAATFDNFMPASCLEPYFALTRDWSGDEFKMVTGDGRTFRIRMDGPQNLPTLFEVSDRGGVFRRMEWAYFKVGEVGPANFLPPEGAVPRAR